MTEQENLQITKDGYAAFGRGDIQAVISLYADDCEFISPGPPSSIPYAGTYHGPKEIAQFFTKLGESLEFESFEPQEFIAAEDKVIVIGTSVGTARTTGKKSGNNWVHIITLRDGKFVKFHVYDDTAAVVELFAQAKQPV